MRCEGGCQDSVPECRPERHSNAILPRFAFNDQKSIVARKGKESRIDGEKKLRVHPSDAKVGTLNPKAEIAQAYGTLAIPTY